MKYGTYYHGTSADHLQDILANGLGGYRTERIWNDSFPQHLYLWDRKAVAESNDSSEEDDSAFQFAQESGRCALVRAKDCRIIVIEVRIPTDWVVPDTSGLNMDDLGAVCTDMIISPKYFKKISISNDLSILRHVIVKEYFTCQNARLTPTNLERLVIKSVNEDFFLFDEMDWILQWEEVPVNRPLKLKVA